MTKSTKYALLAFNFALFTAGTAVASPLFAPLSARAACINQNRPDTDLLGLGVRIGVYLQISALILAVCCGESDTLSAIPAAIVTALTLNIVLSMKASIRVFDANPVVQDFWVTQNQLFLLVTLLPYMFLFGRWDYRPFGVTKCVLMLLAIIYTYTQTFWFWTSGYKNSDELVCGVAETMLGRYALFRDNGRYAILVVYSVGLVIVLVMLPNFIRVGRPGYFAPLIRKVSKISDWGKALALALVCVPLVTVVIVLIENSVRRGTQSEWVKSTGQWLALGVGFCTAAEALWHVLKNTYRELSGGTFAEGEEDHFLREEEAKEKSATQRQREASQDIASERLLSSVDT